jgi:hypothetical protein
VPQRSTATRTRQYRWPIIATDKRGPGLLTVRRPNFFEQSSHRKKCSHDLLPQYWPAALVAITLYSRLIQSFARTNKTPGIRSGFTLRSLGFFAGVIANQIRSPSTYSIGPSRRSRDHHQTLSNEPSTSRRIMFIAVSRPPGGANIQCRDFLIMQI